MKLFDKQQVLPIMLEEEAHEGVQKIAEKVIEDIEKVCGNKPQLLVEKNIQEGLQKTEVSQYVFVGTIGKSSHIDQLLATGQLLEGNLKKEREVYSWQWVDHNLYIIGSDKRGTIYGLFALSEKIGVSPLVYFGDATIVRLEECILEEETFFSKQPSVKYRGFFINDEWPAFGNWATDTFGDVNAKAYDKIFELLLRMKGNYLWPAMWNSSFSEDGPGIENAALADMYGVIMGTSHHEPLCRAGVEWQQQYQKYGKDSTWNFLANREAITAFWEDGMRRNKDFENVVTIGMRGESDSKLLPEDATMADNVQVLKEAILEQHRILRDECGKPLSEIPRMLAIYKEVEQYYYGDHTCEGLKDWEELSDVIFLLSDDNHGNLRALPTEEERKHPGGFGMYYHVDYHGGPISYEWVNSTKISKIWEQMTTAYEYGIRDMWIVNVGDLKGNEYPLSFFMDMAYDYDTYGIQGSEQILAYPYKWAKSLLGSKVSEEDVALATEVLNGYVAFNAVRRPEYTNADVYHPFHYGESQWVEEETGRLLLAAEYLYKKLPKEALPAYESCIYYPALASLNLHRMNACAGRNHGLAKRGSLSANVAADHARQYLHQMEKAVEDFHACLDGKWNHMMLSAHTGFRSWDDYNWTYPTFQYVEPIPYPKAMVVLEDSERYHLGSHWQAGDCDISYAFLQDRDATVNVYVESRGNVNFTFDVACDCSSIMALRMDHFLEEDYDGVLDVCKGETGHIAVSYATDSEEKRTNPSVATMTVKISFVDGSKTEMKVQFALPQEEDDFYDGIIALDAADYAVNMGIEEDAFEVIPDRGRWRDAIKCSPVNKDFTEIVKTTLQNLKKDGKETLKEANAVPYITYEIRTKEAAKYQVIFELVPANPDHFGGRFGFFYDVNGEEIQEAYGVSADYNTEYACREWDYGVVNHTRKVTVEATLKVGVNELTIYPGQPGYLLERILLVKEGVRLPASYLGPSK